jgi:hypothetical protein
MEQERDTGVVAGPCWCTRMDFSAELLARVAPNLKDRACICASCAGGAARG